MIDTKQTLIDSYLALLKKNDFNKVNVTKIIEDVKISRQTFYYYFDSLEEMVIYIFNKNTQEVCRKAKTQTNWIDAADGYVDFLKKYDIIIKKSLKTDKFIFVYNLLYGSFFDFAKTYLVSKRKTFDKSTALLAECWAGALTSLVIKTSQTNNTDYYSMLVGINRGINSL